MPPSPPSHPPHYPPRAGRLWVGRRAKVAMRAERSRNALVRVASSGLGLLRESLVALVPGLPIGLRHGRRYGWAVFVAWALALIGFLALVRRGATTPVRFRSLIFGLVEFQPIYLVFGLAAGLHILGAQEHLRPILQDFLASADAKSRWILTIAAALAIAALIYYGLYAPLLER